MSLFSREAIEYSKTKALELFFKNDLNHAIGELSWCLKEIQEYSQQDASFEEDAPDSIDLYFIYSLLGLSFEKNGDIEKSILYYRYILELEISNFVMDDLWIYFARGLAISRIGDENGVDYMEVHNELIKGFEIFPNDEKDFSDDITYNTRINIINKFGFLLQEAVSVFNYKIIKLYTEDGTVKNFALMSRNSSDKEILAMFGYKRTDFYGEDFTNKGYRDMIDQARSRLQK